MTTTDEQGQIAGLGWAFGRWRKVFARIDKESIRDNVDRLRQAHSDEDESRLARRVIRSAARGAAMAGVVTSSPALLPGFGTAVSVVGIVPEEIFLVHRKCRMILEIATIFEFDPSEDERLYEIILLAGSPSRSIEALMTAKEDLKRLAARSTEVLGVKSRSVPVFGFKTVSRRTIQKLPAIGFFLGSLINFIGVRAVGLRACRFYEHLTTGNREEVEA